MTLAGTRPPLISETNQGDAVGVAPIDYNALMLDELEQIENFSPNCKDELKCLSHCIRRYLWKNNTEKLWKLITRLNILTKVLADIFSPEEYWNQNTIIDYAKAAEEAKKAEAESVLKKLLAAGMSADEILAKLK